MPIRRLRFLALVVAAAVTAAVTGNGAAAQVNDPLPVPTTLPDTGGGTTTTSTTRPPTTTSTTARRTTSTTAPRSGGSSPTLPTSSTLPPGGGDGPMGTGAVPPDAQSLIQSIPRSPANNTRRLLAALRPLMDLGLTEAEAVQLGFGRFPVGGEATYSHDWWFPRHVPSFHLHEGTDIFALDGTPVRAPVDGVLEQANGSIGGLSVYIRQPSGGYVYMSHLREFEPGQVNGQQVKVGDVVGRVGTTGNAKGTAPHVHFEIHPAPTKVVTTGRGRNQVTTTVEVAVPLGTQLEPTDPKDDLDAWLVEAEANVPKLIAAVEAGRPRAIIATGLTRRLADGSGGPFAAPSGPPRSQLLWAASAGPVGGALRLAEAEASAAADSVDYEKLAAAETERIRQWEAEDAFARAVLAPLTPSGLRPVLRLSRGSSRTGAGARSPRP